MQHSWRTAFAVACTAVASLWVACGGDAGSRTRVDADPPAASAAPPEPTRPAGTVARARIVALGDSLTAGLGLQAEESYPALLQERIDELSLPYDVVNAGVSGDTSAGGLRRLDWALDGNVAFLIVALGGNDALRGLPPDELRQNLESIIERAESKDIEVILAGMEAPPNLGGDYTASFRGVYRSLAEEHDVTLVPFLLADVAGIQALNQRDGIHPNVEGTRKVADHVWAVLRPMLERASRPGTPPATDSGS